jgi:hypothetical protein
MAGLFIDLRRPTGAFLYNMTTPRLTIDGYDVPVNGWGPQQFDVVAGGPHRVEIHVPYVFPRKVGRATLDVTVPEQGVALEYMAPSFTFAKGALGPAGQQKSSGFKAVQAFNIGMVVLVAVGYIIIKLNT